MAELSKCPVCTATLNGDDAFLMHHLNKCLDAVASERASTPPALDTPSEAQDETLPMCGSCGKNRGVLGLSGWAWEDHLDACYDAQEDIEYDQRDIRTAVVVQAPSKIKSLLRSKTSESSTDGTPHIIPLLVPLLARSHKEGKTRSALLCSEHVEHIGTRLLDYGWGCGYRNAQMLFTSLRHLECYTDLFPLEERDGGLARVPSIEELQRTIEVAWHLGHDPPGAAHFKNRLVGSKKWIGATDIYTCFTAMGIRAKVVDFPKATEGQGSHTLLVKWILDYFSNSPSSPSSSRKRSPEESEESALARIIQSNGTPVRLTRREPLYLQHDGHSRTVVGIDRATSGDWLLVFDCGKSVNSSIKAAAKVYLPSNESVKRRKTFEPLVEARAQKDERAFWRETLGEAKIWKGKTSSRSSEGEGRANGLELRGSSKYLEGFRVSLNSLGRRDEYQILYVEEGPPLTQKEKVLRRIVASTRIVA